MGNCSFASQFTPRMIDKIPWEREEDISNSFDFLEHVGKGSVSTIFKIRRKKMIIPDKKANEHACQRSIEEDGIYALKEIRLHTKKDYCEKELRNEIDLLHHLDHPNIIRAFEVYRDGPNHLAVVLDLCRGGDLNSRFPYTEKNAAYVVFQIVEAVRFLHSHRIMHRDLKLENIMFEFDDPSDFSIKLIDFGLATVYSSDRKIFHERVGTLYTMAPEVLRKNYTCQADMWSIGVIAFHLLCGHRPFRASSKRNLKRQICQGTSCFRDPTWKSLPWAARDFIRRLLQPDPQLRCTADVAIRHPWLRVTNEVSALRTLPEDSLKALVEFSNSSDFHKLVLQVIARKASAADIRGLRHIFSDLDLGKNGVITRTEFRKALTRIKSFDIDHVDELFDDLDVDKSGVLEYTEFLAAELGSHIALKDSCLHDAFRDFDTDGSGYITRQDLRSIFGEQASDLYIDKLIEQGDFGGDGKIDYHEFVRLCEGAGITISAHT
jgi:calcium-dependent protein kinase